MGTCIFLFIWLHKDNSKITFFLSKKLVWNLTKDQHFPCSSLPLFLSSEKQDPKTFQIFISYFSACDSLVVWSSSSSLSSIHPRVRKVSLFLMWGDKELPVLDATATGDTPITSGGLCPTPQIWSTWNHKWAHPAAPDLHLSGCISSKWMHKFTHSKTWSVQELVTMTI